MREPNFMLIGAAKAATTTMASLLVNHPQSAMVQGKEPHYFSMRYNQATYAQYLQLYEHCTDEIAIGDGSTSYSRIRYHPGVPERIHAQLPDVKIIYMVRHPIKRMESAYVEHAATASSHAFPSINEAVRQMPMIVDSSRYWEVFDTYRQVFEEEQIKIVWFEEFISDPTATFAEVCRFLGIDPEQCPDTRSEIKNTRSEATRRMEQLGRDARKLNVEWIDQTRREVIDSIRDDNLRFLQHFGKPTDYWGNLFTLKPSTENA